MKYIVIFILVSLNLFATEMDQFTLRDTYEDQILDYTESLNGLTEEYFLKAVNSYNKKYCGKNNTLDESRRLFAFEIWKKIAAEKWYPREPKARQKVPWYHAYHKTGKGPLQKRIMKDSSRGYVRRSEQDVFDFLNMFTRTYTMKVGETLLGIDKVDHFFDQGYEYYLSSGYGKSDEKAIGYGVSGENGWYGKVVSGVYSYADLKANFDGYMFYKTLFADNSVFKLDIFSCVYRDRYFDWGEIIDWEYDELLNTSVYSKRTYEVIAKYLKKNLHNLNYCKTYTYAVDRNLFGRASGRSDYYTGGLVPDLLENPFEETLSELCK